MFNVRTDHVFLKWPLTMSDSSDDLSSLCSRILKFVCKFVHCSSNEQPASNDRKEMNSNHAYETDLNGGAPGPFFLSVILPFCSKGNALR